MNLIPIDVLLINSHLRGEGIIETVFWISKPIAKESVFSYIAEQEIHHRKAFSQSFNLGIQYRLQNRRRQNTG